jgi:hypothetical protein
MAARSRPTKAEIKRAQAEAARAAAARAQRRSRQLRAGLWAAGAIVVAALVVTTILVLNRSPAPTSTGTPAPPASAQGRTTSPPWDAPADASAAVAAAGLPMLGEEGSAVHIHAHLDIIVNGSAIQVPADIGVDDARQKISPLHSHDTTGVIHIESPTPTTFTLGQFFSEWQVSLAADHIGGLVADNSHHLKVYVNGTRHDGDPAGIVLAAHDEIAIVYGTDAQQQNPPRTYSWSNGL